MANSHPWNIGYTIRGGVAAVVTTSFQYNILEIVYESSSSTNTQEEKTKVVF